jgi:spermidine synthase
MRPSTRSDLSRSGRPEALEGRRAFALIFAASGAAALVYEVTWTRLLTLQLGHGVAAASTVLAAFMGGLAVGAAVAGRVGPRLDATQALRVYAGLELTIAALALTLPFELDALEPLFILVYANGDGGATFGLLRLAASLLLLAFPAAAMGATFPIASRWFVQHAHRAALDAGSLYAANTVGAALGALLAGFVLLPALGLSGTTRVGVALNLIAAGGAWWIASRAPTSVEDASPRASDLSAVARSAKAEPTRRQRRRANERARDLSAVARSAKAETIAPSPALAAAALGISGFASLTLQVVWTRLLAQVLGPTTYAFSTMVGVFIAGLAIGAAIGARLAIRSRQPAAGLAICLAASAACAALSAVLVDRALLSLAAFVARPDVTFQAVLARQALVALGLLAPMTIAFGVAFPFAVAVATRTDDTVSSDLGLIYAVNTAGAIAGALLTGFVLISWLGLHGTIRAIIVVSAVGSLAVLWASGASGRARWLAAASAVVVLAFGVWLPPWDQLLLSSGAYKYAASLRAPDLAAGLRAGRLLYYREGPSGTVAVRRVAGSTSLAIDGKVDASNSGDMLTQRLLAHVPLLLHPNPKRAAILGLGSGVTLGSALRHPLDRADVLEISPEVVEASRFFDVENHHALQDARTRLIVGDGRSHLLLTREQYDVIVSEPSNPWMAGIASLFTKEFFEAARSRLAPGGVLCQWAHTYDISTADLQSIVATFMSVFPGGTLWLVGDGDVLLIGSNTPIEDRLSGMAAAWQRPGVKEDLASVGVMEPVHVLSLLVAEGERLQHWAAGAPVQTDDRAELEFSGPQSIFGRARDDNAALLRQLAASGTRPPAVEAAVNAASAASWRERGWMFYRADGYRPAYADFTRALESDPRDQRALEGLLVTSTPAERSTETRVLLGRLASDAANGPAKIAFSRFLAAQGAYEEAARVAFSILQSNPGSVAALEQMASILADVGDKERMAPIVSRLRAEAPASDAAHYYSAALLFIEGRTELALREARAVIAKNPGHAKAQNLAGACLANLGQRDQARAAFEASIAADPKEPATYTNLAMLELEAGNPERAEQYFAEALTIDPTSEVAREGLQRIRNRG